MLSKGFIAVLQAGQREPGYTIDSRFGMRYMTTFKKLPIISPKTNAKAPTRYAEILSILTFPETVTMTSDDL
jgi:hypothetical protein